MPAPRRAQTTPDLADDGARPVAYRALEAEPAVEDEAVTLDRGDDDFAGDPLPGLWRRRIAGTVLLLGCAGLAVGLPMRHGDGTSEAAATPGATSTPTDAIGTSRSAERPALDVMQPTPGAAPTSTASASSSATPSTTPKAGPSSTPVTVPSTPAASPSATATPTVDATTRGKAIASRWATSTVNVRTAPSADADRIATVQAGTELKATDRRIDGWRQVVVDGHTGWVSTDYLSTDKPAAASSTASASKGTSASSTSSGAGTSSATSGAGTSEGTCPSYGVESGLVSAAVHVHRVICKNFPAVTEFNGYRAGDQEHGTGHAIDAMISGDAGWTLANWARAHASELGISQVIYAQHIWTTQRSSEGWRSMSDRGSTTANHYDHVHITVS